MDLREEVEVRGFALRRGVLGPRQLEELLGLVFPVQVGMPGGPTPHALRNVLWEREGVAEALSRLGVDGLATEVCGADAFPINALYFDKTAGANWKVPCHQDVMMPVEERLDEPGFSGWGEKAGVAHVEPPHEVLATLIALRIHFDDCPAANGSLAILPGSHRGGKLRDPELARIDRGQLVECEAGAGDVLLMRPLVVHRSAAARDPVHRRVLHVVYASQEPGTRLRWRRGDRR